MIFSNLQFERTALSALVRTMASAKKRRVDPTAFVLQDMGELTVH